MNAFLTDLRHSLYRLKTRILEQSGIATWYGKQIWNKPGSGVVSVFFREDQDIRPYFDFNEISDNTAREKLKDFTERYALEPNIIYEVSGNIIIEPNYGLAINEGRQFICESGTLSHLFLHPPLLPYFFHRWFRRKYTEYDYLIHCDGFAGINLCHFIYDTINPILFLFERKFIDEQSPILISEKVYSKAYFQYFLANTLAGKLNWVVQGANEWIRVKHFKKAFVSMETFKRTYAILDHQKNPTRKVFLNRARYFQRTIKNIDSIVAILQRHGFEIIHAENISYADQVKLFREIKYFVGIHGAGLTNLLHSDIPSLRVLEIFPKNLIHASFYRFLQILQVHYYDAIAGSDMDQNFYFTVDEKDFEAKILKLIAA